eukprot:463672_1
MGIQIIYRQNRVYNIIFRIHSSFYTFVLYYDPHDTKSRAMFELLETLLGVLPALPVVIMYVKLPRFVNIFYLKYELQLFFYWCLGCIPICVGVDTLSVYFA